MFQTTLRRIVAKLPSRWQRKLRRLHFRRRIHGCTFVSDEPEFAALEKLIGPSDWVIDIGANVGFYTKRMSELVGSSGRVLAFEPVPETFVILANNMESGGCVNVSLFNVAVSETVGLAGMVIPRDTETGQFNFYQAHLSSSVEEGLQVLMMSLDSLRFPKRIRLVKIDAEGHEFSVLKGMRTTLEKDRPILIVETPGADVEALLSSLSYKSKGFPGSPNAVFYRGDKRWEEISR